MKPSKKIVKGWAVLNCFGELDQWSYGPLWIYGFKPERGTNQDPTYRKTKVVPCTITYSLPNKPKC